MNIIPALQTGTLIVVCAPHAAREESAVLAAQLALHGAVTVLDGGNRLVPYRVAHLIRQRTTDVASAANRLFIRRAFTCYQMIALLESTPYLHQPYLVLDLLATFYDDHVPTYEARRLLDVCLQQVDRLRHTAPVAITLAPPLVPERAFLIERVCALADRLFMPEPLASPPAQLALF